MQNIWFWSFWNFLFQKLEFVQQKSARSGQLNVRSFKRFIGREARLFTRPGSSGGSCFRRLSLLFATLPDNVRVPRSQYMYTHTHIGQSMARKHEEKCGVSCTGLLSRKTFAYAVEQGRNSLGYSCSCGSWDPRRTRSHYQSRWTRAKLSFPAATKEPANSLGPSVRQLECTCETRTRTC